MLPSIPTYSFVRLRPAADYDDALHVVANTAFQGGAYGDGSGYVTVAVELGVHQAAGFQPATGSGFNQRCVLKRGSLRRPRSFLRKEIPYSW